MKVCSYFNGGDCVTIEQYVLHSMRNAGAKIQNIFQKLSKRGKKILLWVLWLS